jgi:hypothetical protein
MQWYSITALKFITMRHFCLPPPPLHHWVVGTHAYTSFTTQAGTMWFECLRLCGRP